MLPLSCECRLQSGNPHRPVPDTVRLSEMLFRVLGLEQGLTVLIK